MMSNIELFRQINKTPVLDVPQISPQCEHLIYDILNNYEKVCVLCGELLEENCLVNDNITSLKQRRKRECTLFDEIPHFLSEKTRDTAIDIYRNVMGDTIDRTLRKAILFACIHRASIICRESLSFDDLIEYSGIKPQKACRGINYIVDKLQKNSEYTVSFFHSDEMIIQSIMKNIDLEDQVPYINEIVKIISATSNLFNTSHYKSVVCGCVYFWLTINKCNISLAQFSQKVKVSYITIKKKYFDIKIILIKYLMRYILSNLLQKCDPRDLKYEPLYNKELGFCVEDWDILEKIKIKNSKNYYLPLNNVSDLLQWNIILNTTYTSLTSNNQYVLNITLEIKNKDIYFDFTHYNDANNENGSNIMNNTIITFFKKLLKKFD